MEEKSREKEKRKGKKKNMPRTGSPVRGGRGCGGCSQGVAVDAHTGLGIPGTAQTAAPGEKKVCRVTTKDVCYWRSI